MIAANALRIAVTAWLVLMPLTLGITFWTEGQLPSELVDFRDSQQDHFTIFDPILEIEWLMTGGVFITLGIWIGSVVGLLKMKRWGAWLYLLGIVVGLPLYFLSGFEIFHPLEQVVGDINNIVSGLILGLAFFSDAIPKKPSALPTNCG